jgi:Protein of unknown function (DUF541)
MSSAQRFLSVGLALGLVLGLAGGALAGVSLTNPGHAQATKSSAAPAVATSGAARGAPAAAPGVASGSAIAYPYSPGSPGIAPDHTIVVTGTGQAEVAADGSDRLVAQKRALDAALADAKSQADAIAAATGLSISGVLSVSAAVAPYYALPMAGATSGGVPTPVVPPLGSTTGPGAPSVPLPAPLPATPQELSVSVTVEYAVG